MIENFKNISLKSVLVMIIGNIIVSLGVAIFKIAGLGNDPFNAMLMAVYAKLNIHYGTLSAIVSLILFLFQFKFGKKYIGYGTLFNTFAVGYIIAFFIAMFESRALVPSDLSMKILVMIAGVVICALGISVYQLANLGTAPFDSISLLLSERFPNISYFWWRMLTDGTCALIAFLFGGLLGIGSLVAMFGFGPIVEFFNRILKPYLAKK